MKTLNFFPIYRFLIETCFLKTSVRLGEKYARELKPGDHVQLTLGWNEKEAVPIITVQITYVITKKLKNVNVWDLVGESPDCVDPHVLPYVLGAIYHKEVSPEDFVTIIYWRYL